MNFIKYTYEKLKASGYFEANVNIIFTQAPKKHRRLVEGFLCSSDNSKLFTRGYLKLKEELAKDKTLAKSIVTCYKELVYDNLCNDRSSIKLDATRYINILLLSLFINEKGILKIGNTQSDFEIFRVIKILTNEKYSTSRTLREVQKIIPLGSEIVEDIRAIEIAIYIIFSYTVNLLEPVIFMNQLSNSLYKTSIGQLVESAKETRIKARRKLGSIHFPFLLYCNISSRDLTEVDKSIEKLDLTTYKRVGFLKPEYAVGETNARYSKICKTTADIKITYYVNEVIHKDGVLIKFQILTKDYIIFAIDDYIKGKQILYIMFYDTSFNNSDTSMQSTAFMYYCIARDEYAKKINEEKYTVPSVDIYDEDETATSNDDDKYTRKLIQIAPYKRLLPVGSKRGEGKLEEAAKFNMVLKDNETFVNSFDKHCRILKDSIVAETGDIRFETQYV